MAEDAEATRRRIRRLQEGHRGRGSPAGGPHPDLISLLPDEILGSVITLLPTRDGARTQILSHRWRPLWLSAPLNLEGCDDERLAAIFRDILSRHKAPLRRFSLSYGEWLDPLLQSPRIYDFQELEIHIYLPCYGIPPSVLHCLPAVSVLGIISSPWRNDQFPLQTACVLHFPHLKQLTLACVGITESTLNGVLSRCPVLESLLLDSNFGCRRIQISSLTLRSLGVSDGAKDLKEKLEELIIEDAPLLEKLIPCVPNNGLVIRVIHAPKLKTLGYLHDDIPVFELGAMLFEKMVLVSLPNEMRSVKILALLTAPNLDIITGFLKCFPCVERLYIVSYTQMIIKNEQGYAPLECLDRHLKKMQIINYEEDKMADVNFIKFFVLNARVLESMKIVVRNSQCDPEWIATQHKKLQVDDRASQGARFDFEADKRRMLSSMVQMGRIHDLAMDPFNG